MSLIGRDGLNRSVNRLHPCPSRPFQLADCRVRHVIFYFLSSLFSLQWLCFLQVFSKSTTLSVPLGFGQVVDYSHAYTHTDEANFTLRALRHPVYSGTCGACAYSRTCLSSAEVETGGRVSVCLFDGSPRLVTYTYAKPGLESSACK